MYTIDYFYHEWSVISSFSISNMEKNFSKVVELLYQKIPELMPSNATYVNKDYCVYVAGHDEIKYYGVTWKKGNVTYSAKGNSSGLKDLYVIHAEGPIASEEIDWDTLQPVAIYQDEGYTKKSIDGEVLLASNKITTAEDLPKEFVDMCIAKKFPWYVFAYGFSIKPYGAAIEFSLPEWINALYN